MVVNNYVEEWGYAQVGNSSQQEPDNQGDAPTFCVPPTMGQFTELAFGESAAIAGGAGHMGMDKVCSVVGSATVTSAASPEKAVTVASIMQSTSAAESEGGGSSGSAYGEERPKGPNVNHAVDQ